MVQWGAVINIVINFWCHEGGGELLDQLSDYHLLKKEGIMYILDPVNFFILHCTIS
jgi:hypothetical protein